MNKTVYSITSLTLEDGAFCIELSGPETKSLYIDIAGALYLSQNTFDILRDLIEKRLLDEAVHNGE